MAVWRKRQTTTPRYRGQLDAPLPSAFRPRAIVHRAVHGTSGQQFWLFPKQAWNNCIIFYSCFQRLIYSGYIFSTQSIGTLSWAKKKIIFFFPVITLDSYLSFNTLIYSTVTTRNFFKKLFPFSTFFFYQNIKFLPPKYPFLVFWLDR